MFSKGSTSRKILCTTGAVVAVGFGGAYAAYHRRLKENSSCTAEEFNAAQNQEDLRLALTHIADPKKCPPVLLYRYSTCPFCSTTKSFLDYNKVPHTCVEVEPMFKREISMNAYKKVPQLKFCVKGDEGPFLVDSEIIVSTIAKSVGMGRQLDDPEVKRWRVWARGPLVRLLTLEFNSSLFKAWRAYSYIDDIETIPYRNKLFLKVVGAPVMYLVAHYVTKPRLIKSGHLLPTEDVKVRLHGEVNRFVVEALQDGKRKFHGGAKPDLADLDTHGVLQSVRGHRIYEEIIKETAIKQWLDHMDEVMGREKYVSQQ
uniref:Putative glutathione-S-transferase/glutaredoxin n=1 Tax=Trypanosoma congolense (strain IL3000) TaxID=1068625 RepID=G0UPZ7_TRYCI|nr:putative glutathione-S-transferase/glutaredoxin [Trypanosoma congolense IL3000]